MHAQQIPIYHFLFQASSRCPVDICWIELGCPLCRVLYLENLPFRCPPCPPLCQMSCPVTCLVHLLSRVWCLVYRKCDGSFQSSKPGITSLSLFWNWSYPIFQMGGDTASSHYRGLGSLIALLCLLYHLIFSTVILQMDPMETEGLTQHSSPKHGAASWSCRISARLS